MFDNNGNPSGSSLSSNPSMGGGVRVIDNGGGSVRVSIPTETAGSYLFNGPFVDSGVGIGGLYSGRDASELGHLGASPEPMRVSSGGAQPVASSGGQKFTARTQDGFTVTDPAQLSLNDVVTIGGMETSVEVALNLGLLRRDANGIIRGATGEDNAAQQQQQDQQGDEAQQQQGEKTRLDDASEAMMGQVFDNDPGAAVDAMQDAVFGEDGTVSDASINALASANGWEPEAARQNVASIQQAYANEAYTAAARQAGTDIALATEALMAAGAERSTAIQEAMSQHFMTGKPDGYAPFVTAYVANIANTPEGAARVMGAQLAQGIALHQADDGTVLVTMDGFTMSYADAVLQGRIVVGRK